MTSLPAHRAVTGPFRNHYALGPADASGELSFG